jgi:hypothetical protein
MAAVSAFSQIVKDQFNVVFQGDPFTDLDSVEEIVVAIDHGSSSQTHGTALGQALSLCEDGDAILTEGMPLFHSKWIPVVTPSGTVEIQIFGWDHLYNGAAEMNHTPKFWSFYEDRAHEQHRLTVAQRCLGVAKGKQREQIQKTIQAAEAQLKRLSADPQSDDYVKRAVLNWEKRQDSLMAALQVLGTARACSGFFNESVVFRRSVLITGRSHVINHPDQFPELHASVDQVRAFLKGRNAIILVPKT